MRATQELYRLQTIDLELDRIRASLESSPLAAAAREAEARVESLQATLADLALARQELAREVRRLELEAQAARAEQRRAEEELYAGGKSGKELGLLQQRAARAASQAEALETQGLERMEEAERLEAQQAHLQQSLELAQEEASQRRMAREMELDELRLRQADLEAERVQVWERVPLELRRRYERMRRQMPNPVAAVVRGRCGACHLTLPQGILNRLRADEGLVQCEQCGRLLHLL